MNKIVKLYRQSSWHAVYNLIDTGGKARTSLLAAIVSQAVINGFSAGTFYTGLLLGYGINMVNISIVTMIPYIASFFTLFTPYVLERFKKRRLILTIARTMYYVVNILGITLLPQLVHNETGRIVGLSIIVFIANAINFLFNPGYSPWHMHYITPEIRNDYFSSTTLFSSISSSIVLVLASIVTEQLEGDALLNLIIALRYVAFGMALLDVYFCQKPKEPEYQASKNRPSLLDVFRLPLSNKKFLLTMVIYGLYAFSANIASSVSGTWLLDEVETGYLYQKIIDALYILAILGTSGYWSKIVKKKGTFRTLIIGLLIHAPTYVAYAFVTKDNFLWLMTAVRLTQHVIGFSLTFTLNNLIYVNLPRTDQTNYISFYNISANLMVFLGMTCGTSIVAAMGEKFLNFFGFHMTSVPSLLFLQAILFTLLALFIIAIRKKVEPDEIR